MSDLTWKPVVVRIGDLKPWERNPRRMGKRQAERLLKSWKEMGQWQTLAIGPNNELYDGHQRLRVLRTVYGDDYQVLALRASRPLSEEERERIVLEGHAGAMGAWDWGALKQWDAEILRQYGLDEAMRSILAEDIENLEQILQTVKPKAKEKAEAKMPQVWLVIIECATEQEQTRLFQRFQEEGLKCRLVTS